MDDRYDDSNRERSRYPQSRGFGRQDDDRDDWRQRSSAAEESSFGGSRRSGNYARGGYDDMREFGPGDARSRGSSAQRSTFEEPRRHDFGEGRSFGSRVDQGIDRVTDDIRDIGRRMQDWGRETRREFQDHREGPHYGERYAAENEYDRGARYGQSNYDDARRGYGRGSGYDGNYAYSGADDGRPSGGYSGAGVGVPQRQQPYDWGSRDRTFTSGRETQTSPYVGKGPKGYKRSDDRIREEVCERLAWDGEVDASDIAVTVQNGEVMLEGTVETRRMKHRSEDVVDEIRGVIDVHNRLTVRRGFFGELKDRISGKEDTMNHVGQGVKSATTTSPTGTTAAPSTSNGRVGVPTMNPSVSSDTNR